MNLLKDLRDILNILTARRAQARITAVFPLVAGMGSDELNYRLLQGQARDCPSVATYAELIRAVRRMRDPRAPEWLAALDAQFRQPIPRFDENGERCGPEHAEWWAQQQAWWREACQMVDREAAR